MNLLLLEPNQLDDAGHATLSPRQVAHLNDVLGAAPGDTIRAGIVDGAIGDLKLERIDASSATGIFTPKSPPPAPLPAKLVLALPRPKMLRRILRDCAMLGFKEIVLVNTCRVEKSYWKSPLLTDEKIREQLLLGLEQAVDTRVPTVTLERLFKPFVQDRLPQWSKDTRRLVLHPRSTTPCPTGIDEPVTLAIGPEGGFIDYEVELLESVGFEGANLGPRILRVETVLPWVGGRLFAV